MNDANFNAADLENPDIRRLLWRRHEGGITTRIAGELTRDEG